MSHKRLFSNENEIFQLKKRVKHLENLINPTLNHKIKNFLSLDVNNYIDFPYCCGISDKTKCKQCKEFINLDDIIISEEYKSKQRELYKELMNTNDYIEIIKDYVVYDWRYNPNDKLKYWFNKDLRLLILNCAFQMYKIEKTSKNDLIFVNK